MVKFMAECPCLKAFALIQAPFSLTVLRSYGNAHRSVGYIVPAGKGKTAFLLTLSAFAFNYFGIDKLNYPIPDINYNNAS